MTRQRQVVRTWRPLSVARTHTLQTVRNALWRVCVGTPSPLCLRITAGSCWMRARPSIRALTTIHRLVLSAGTSGADSHEKKTKFPHVHLIFRRSGPCRQLYCVALQARTVSENYSDPGSGYIESTSGPKRPWFFRETWKFKFGEHDEIRQEFYSCVYSAGGGPSRSPTHPVSACVQRGRHPLRHNSIFYSKVFYHK